MNSFLFIVPLTPPHALTINRGVLRKLCLDTLRAQTYGSWKALLVGSPIEGDPADERFIYLPYDGPKEEKLQVATQYALDNAVPGDYVIRLDDDDVFNPGLLQTLSRATFDLYVDKYHSFMLWGSGQIAQHIKSWFPNTCVHRREHAFKTTGEFPWGEYKRLRPVPRLIENSHDAFHHYYGKEHKVAFAKKTRPVYLRVINSDSITSAEARSYTDYLNQFGYWKDLQLVDFGKVLSGTPFSDTARVRQGLKTRIKYYIYNLRASMSFRKVIVDAEAKATT